jgi:molecular chaperone GrpE (heat shock protein)
MTTQLHVAPSDTRPEMSSAGTDRGGLSEQAESRKPMSSTSSEEQNGRRAKAARRLLLALDDFDSLLADAPALPDPDHEGWRAALYPWIEDLARARKHVEEALASLGVEHLTAAGEAFDPACHQLVATEESGAGFPPQHVIRVVRPGFRLGALVLRRARVVVTPPPRTYARLQDTDPSGRAQQSADYRVGQAASDVEQVLEGAVRMQPVHRVGQ